MHFIRGTGDSAALLATSRDAASPGFDPEADLSHVGLANQTTMLMSESLEIGDMFRDAMRDRYSETELASRYRAFDTICSATQDRQDAVIELLAAEPLDLMVVIGGYNSSNTCNLAHICAEKVPTFHIAEPQCLISPGEVRHKPVGRKDEVAATGWLPSGGAVRIGLTSGASTPDNLVEQVIERLDAFAGNPSS
jgi:4-hydroxy-3-methylbut-2-enyl diphosphate reductase